MNKPITIRIDEKNLDMFRKKYPKLLSTFIGKVVFKSFKDNFANKCLSLIHI